MQSSLSLELESLSFVKCHLAVFIHDAEPSTCGVDDASTNRKVDDIRDMVNTCEILQGVKPGFSVRLENLGLDHCNLHKIAHRIFRITRDRVSLIVDIVALLKRHTNRAVVSPRSTTSRGGAAVCAIKYGEEVKASAYTLLPDFGDVFLQDYANSSESIFAVQHSAKASDGTKFGRGNWSNVLNGVYGIW